MASRINNTSQLIKSPIMTLHDIRYPVYIQPKFRNAHKPLLLTDESARLIGCRIDTLMITRQPYLQPSYSLAQLGKDIDIPYYQVSHYLNQRLGLRFTDFINRFRIDHFKQLVADGQLLNTTLDGIAAQCGFNSRNALGMSFKKFTHMTPSEFMKRHRLSA